MTRHSKPDVAQVITDLILEKITAGTQGISQIWGIKFCKSLLSLYCLVVNNIELSVGLLPMRVLRYLKLIRTPILGELARMHSGDDRRWVGINQFIGIGNWLIVFSLYRLQHV